MDEPGEHPARAADQLERAGVTEPATLFATGGAGGMLAGFVHAAARPRESFAFPVSPVFSAFGLSRLDVRHAYEVSGTSSTMDADLDVLRERALADMRAEGFAPDDVEFSEETEIAAPSGRTRVVPGRVGSDPEGGRPRIVRLIASTRARRVRFPRAGSGRPREVAARQVRWDDGDRPTPVLDWTALAAGSSVPGPAVLETDETTLAVPPGYTVQIGSMGEARVTAL